MLCLSGFELFSRWVPLTLKLKGRITFLSEIVSLYYYISCTFCKKCVYQRTSHNETDWDDDDGLDDNNKIVISTDRVM